MNATLSRLFRVLNMYYDKAIALAVLMLLLVSLMLLLVRIGTDQAEHEKFTREIESLSPAYPRPEALDLSLFHNARRQLREPFQIPAWQRPVTGPEMRVHCVNCERPIPFEAEICYYCKHVQPDEDVVEPVDAWVQKHGVDPRDPTIARRDFDGDGFTVWEEYVYDTNPNDPKSFPPPWIRLRVDATVSEPFQMLFMGRSRVGERLLFQINMRADGRTIWAEMDDEVEGFTLTDYKERFVGEGYSRRDASVLTLKRGDIEIELTRGRVTPHLQHHARIIFEVDGSEHRVIQGRELQVKGTVYRILRIDPDNNRALLEDERNETMWIGKESVGAKRLKDVF